MTATGRSWLRRVGPVLQNCCFGVNHSGNVGSVNEVTHHCEGGHHAQRIIAVLAGMVLMAISACGGDGTDASDDAAAARRSAPATAASRTSASTSGVVGDDPEMAPTRGSWSVRTPSRPGSTRSWSTSFSGLTVSCRSTYKVAGDRFTHFVTNDAGIAEPGDIGTASYDDEGRWVTVSESVGCPGCVQVLAWSLVDGSLTLTLVSVDGQRSVCRRRTPRGRGRVRGGTSEADHERRGAVVAASDRRGRGRGGGDSEASFEPDAGVGCLPGRHRGDVPVPARVRHADRARGS